MWAHKKRSAAGSDFNRQPQSWWWRMLRRPGTYPRPVRRRRSPVRIRRCPATAMPRSAGMSQVDRSVPNERQPSEKGRFVRQPPPGLSSSADAEVFHQRRNDPVAAPTVADTERKHRAGRERPPHVSFALSWSGGKDSALVLWKLRRERLEPVALITT